ncbi:MAG: hypothetical protein EA390_13350 [Balneolaceae bacterium]|nr:MAG: hypothetical protein EA390_13350 [Balneolaceae bacterium]
MQEIKFDEFNSLKFQTLSGGRIYNISQTFTDNDEEIIVGSYQFSYSENSITVVDQRISYALYPYLSIELEDESPKQIIRYYHASGVLLFHDFSYPKENLIRVDLTREASTGDILYVGYSNYHVNSDGNIMRNERFRADSDEPTGFRKTEDREFTYDSAASPFLNLYLPFFAHSNFPGVEFFSANNIKSITEDDRTFEFRYQYGENNQTVNQTLPSGQLITFNYANCPG